MYNNNLTSTYSYYDAATESLMSQVKDAQKIYSDLVAQSHAILSSIEKEYGKKYFLYKSTKENFDKQINKAKQMLDSLQDALSEQMKKIAEVEKKDNEIKKAIVDMEAAKANADKAILDRQISEEKANSILGLPKWLFYTICGVVAIVLIKLMKRL